MKIPRRAGIPQSKMLAMIGLIWLITGYSYHLDQISESCVLKSVLLDLNFRYIVRDQIRRFFFTLGEVIISEGHATAGIIGTFKETKRCCSRSHVQPSKVLTIFKT